MVNEIDQRGPIKFLGIINTIIVVYFCKCPLFVIFCDGIDVFELNTECNNWPCPKFKNKYIN